MATSWYCRGFMKTALQSARITHFSWGQIEVDGQGSAFKDAKLFPENTSYFGVSVGAVFNLSGE